MPESPALRCTVVVVNYNGGEFVLECLDSIVSQIAPDTSIDTVVVDNASTDGSDRAIEDRYPSSSVTLIRADRNLGFGGGVNLALERTESELVVLINNDAVAEPGFVAALAAPFRADLPRLAAVTARILLAGRFVLAPHDDAAYIAANGERWVRVPAGAPASTGVELVNSTGNLVSRSGNGRDRSWLALAESDSSATDVFGLCGGAAAIRRSALDAVGPFDERLFMYYEDTDLSWRLRRAGWEIQYAPDAVVHHRHAASSGVRSPFFLSHNIRNRILVAARNAPPRMYRAAIFRTLVSFAKSLGRCLVPRTAAAARVQAGATARALWQAARLAPSYRADGRRRDRESLLSREFVWEWSVEDR
jgi:N-acetylglucosaminyl-diphospho-decaprenol L-rhamnosyltransferase